MGVGVATTHDNSADRDEIETTGSRPLHRLVRMRGSSIYAGRLYTLAQFVAVTWDGDVASKSDRDELVKCGLVQRFRGYNWITERGLMYLDDLGVLAF